MPFHYKEYETYQVGDRVLIVDDLRAHDPDNICVNNMLQYQGREATITSIWYKDRYGIDVDANNWSWHPDMFVRVEEVRPPDDISLKYDELFE